MLQPLKKLLEKPLLLLPLKERLLWQGVQRLLGQKETGVRLKTQELMQKRRNLVNFQSDMQELLRLVEA
jgi:hypothetical protein